MTQHTTIQITGPYDLREIVLMGFGHRDEKSFDGPHFDTSAGGCRWRLRVIGHVA